MLSLHCCHRIFICNFLHVGGGWIHSLSIPLFLFKPELLPELGVTSPHPVPAVCQHPLYCLILKPHLIPHKSLYCLPAVSHVIFKFSSLVSMALHSLCFCL